MDSFSRNLANKKAQEADTSRALIETNTQINFITNRGLLAYEKLRQVWIAAHLDESETELIVVCARIAKTCGLKVRKVHNVY